MILAIIPCYGDLNVHHVEYRYQAGELKKVYKYTYAQKGIFWLGMLPFIWVNVFTNSHQEALASTVSQFIIHAERDGLL